MDVTGTVNAECVAELLARSENNLDMAVSVYFELDEAEQAPFSRRPPLWYCRHYYYSSFRHLRLAPS